jgi:mono/diheme cytochrome c family protein
MDIRPIRWIALGLCCLVTLVGCGTDPNTAFPPAGTLVARVGSGETADFATLERGRKIYTTSCTECHVARTIANYSVPQWRHYIGIMAPRAGLQPADRAALEAYVVAARESMSRP